MAKARNNNPQAADSNTGARNSAKGAATRKLILEAAEKLMLDEGYAAVSSRRVAKEAGLKAPLVHYYFPTTDELFLAVFRTAVERQFEQGQDPAKAPQSLGDLWSSYCSQEQTALALEFMALANHRKSIREEIAALTERTRQRRAEALSNLINPEALPPDTCSPAGLTVLLIGVARTLVMEKGLGISLGHDDAVRFIEEWLRQLEAGTD